MNLRQHKRRASAGMARRFARIPRAEGTKVYWRHYTRAEWNGIHGPRTGANAMAYCRWLDWVSGGFRCDVQPRSLMDRGFR